MRTDKLIMLIVIYISFVNKINGKNNYYSVDCLRHYLCNIILMFLRNVIYNVKNWCDTSTKVIRLQKQPKLNFVFCYEIFGQHSTVNLLKKAI